MQPVNSMQPSTRNVSCSRPVVTVVTPTYNRSEELKLLYASLLKQTKLNFEWLIIDDGSTDETNEICRAWMKEKSFVIRYLRKSNGGKHTALNYSYNYIHTPLTFIVDSDDTLTEDAIETISDDYSRHKEEADLCGFSYLRASPKGDILSRSEVPFDGMKESFCQCRINRNISGDMAEVWFTKVLQEYRFPEFPGEKFLGEDLVWIRMSEKYKLRFFNRKLYISGYLDEGLTRNRRKHNILSPRGCVLRAHTFLEADVHLRYKMKAMAQYFIYGRFAGTTYGESFGNTQHKILGFICILPAIILYYIWNITNKR